ncbi:DegV family protein [Alkaliphilus crotonatoxidans]
MQIITDSSCDLPKEYIERYNLIVVPLNIELDGETYLDGLELTHYDFYEKIAQSQNLPKTSQPSPQRFIDAFMEGAKKTKEILSIHLSSKLSGTFSCAQLSKEISEAKVEIFDSLSGSMGLGLQVLKACHMVEEGFELNHIIEKLKEYRDQMKVLVYLETLENAVKGGRVSRAKEMVANMLNLKFILHVEEGYVKVLKAIRGKKRAISFMLERIAEKNVDLKDKIVGITHCNRIEDALALKEEIIKRFSPQEVIVTTMGPVIGTHSGEGGLLICY